MDLMESSLARSDLFKRLLIDSLWEVLVTELVSSNHAAYCWEGGFNTGDARVPA
jgi:hypothetical protein